MSMFLVDAQRAENRRLANLTGDTQLTDLRNELKRVEESESVGRSGAKNKRDRINQLKAEILALEENISEKRKRN